MHAPMKYNRTQTFWRAVALFLFGCIVLALLTFVCFRLEYFFKEPTFQIRLTEPLDFAALPAFVTTGLVITTLMSRVRKSFQEI